MEQSPFQTMAAAYRAMGYSVLPLKTQSKRPQIENWSKFCLEHADDVLFERWQRWQGGNIGVCLGVASNIICFDLDNDVAGLHDKIIALLPSTPLAKRGAKGISLFYRYNGEISQSYSCGGQRVLDILSTGRQTVVPPSHHPDGMDYVWTSGTMAEIKADDLPLVSSAAFFQIKMLFRDGPKQSEYAAATHNLVYADTDDKDIIAALGYINCEDYQAWVETGMCLKSHGGDSCFHVWDTWSSKSTKYKSQEMRPKWDSFKRNDLTIATLFYRAYDAGYRPEARQIEHVPDFVLNGLMTGYHPEQWQQKKFAEPVEECSNIEAFPARLTRGHGLPAIIAEEIEKTAIYPQPILAMACALSLAGTILGHKIRTKTDLRTNFYTMGIGYSGSGKDHARKVALKMLIASGLEKRIMGIPRSSAGLISCLRDQCSGVGFLAWDEFGRVLKQITNHKAGNHEKDIVTSILDLFSSANGVYAGYAYSNADGKNPPKKINQPHLSLYGTSVPGHFYESMTGSDANDGFLARLLVFESLDYSLTSERENALGDVSERLIEAFHEWSALPDNSEPQGNVDLEIRPRVVQETALAEKMLKDYRQQMRLETIKCEKNGDHAASAILSRAAEHAAKLALVSSDGDIIESEIAQWALDTADYCSRQLIKNVSDRVASNEYEANTKRLERYLKERWMENESTQWVSKSEILRKFRDIRGRDMQEIIKTMVEGNQIEELAMAANGRTRMAYRFKHSLES